MSDNAADEAFQELADDAEPQGSDGLDELEAGEGEGFDEEGAEEEGFEDEGDEVFEAVDEVLGDAGDTRDGFNGKHGPDTYKFEDAFINALQAEDANAFFRHLLSALSGVANGIDPTASSGETAGPAPRGPLRKGRVGRSGSPPASPVADLQQHLGRYLRQKLDETEALEDLTDLYANHAIDEFLPAIAGFAARASLRPILRRATGEQGGADARGLVRAANEAVRRLARQQGPSGVQAIVPIVRSVGRVAVRRRLPAGALATTLRQVVARIAARPELARTIAGRRRVSGERRRRRPSAAPGWPRLILSGPVEIRIIGR